MDVKSRILYIDDEAELVGLASSFFEDENIPIDTSTNFHEALEKIRTNNYDLIISDARMPSGSGIELFSIIRSEKSFEGKFILVTGNLDTKIEEDSFFSVIYKPIKFQELVDQVKEILSLNLK